MLPALPSTFPNLTATNSVWLLLSIVWIIISAMRLVAPITLVGLTALSDEMSTKLFAPYSSAHRATFNVPNTLFFTASRTFDSKRGTCLCAAAWNTTEGLYKEKISLILSSSLIDAIKTSKSSLLPYNCFNSC